MLPKSLHAWLPETAQTLATTRDLLLCTWQHQQGSVEAARLLLDHGAVVDQPNDHGNTPLFIAVFNSHGRGEMIALLRERSATIHFGQTTLDRRQSAWLASSETVTWLGSLLTYHKVGLSIHWGIATTTLRLLEAKSTALSVSANATSP